MIFKYFQVLKCYIKTITNLLVEIHKFVLCFRQVFTVALASLDLRRSACLSAFTALGLKACTNHSAEIKDVHQLTRPQYIYNSNAEYSELVLPYKSFKRLFILNIIKACDRKNRPLTISTTKFLFAFI